QASESDGDERGTRVIRALCRRRLGATAAALVTVLLAVTAGGHAATAAPLTLRFVDVGEGDAAGLRGPCGGIGVLDVARGGTDAVLRALDGLGSRRVSWVAVSHFDADHAGGVRALGLSPRVRIGTLFDRGVPSSPTATYRAYAAWA